MFHHVSLLHSNSGQGILLDPWFLQLSASLLFCIFVLVELLRYHKVPPWASHLDHYLLVFKDHQVRNSRTRERRASKRETEREREREVCEKKCDICYGHLSLSLSISDRL